MLIIVSEVSVHKIAMYLYSKLIVEVGCLIWGVTATAVHRSTVKSDYRSIPATHNGNTLVSSSVVSNRPVPIILRTICATQVRESIVKPVAIYMVYTSTAKNHGVHSDHSAIVVGDSIPVIGDAPLKRSNHVDISKVNNRAELLLSTIDDYLGTIVKNIYLVLMGVWLLVPQCFVSLIVLMTEAPGVMYRLASYYRTGSRMLSGFISTHSMLFYHTTVFNNRGI